VEEEGADRDGGNVERRSPGGRLAVIVGFNAGGSPIVNDPAAASDVAVYRAYALSELETLWLQAHREGGYIHTRL